MSEKDSLYSLFYAVWRPEHWGKYSWATIMCMSIYVDTKAPEKKRLLIKFREKCLPDVLPCKTCTSPHLLQFLERYSPYVPIDSYMGASYFWYLLRKNIQQRTNKQDKQSFDQFVEQYKEFSVKSYLTNLIRFLHFVALTYPDLKGEAMSIQSTPTHHTSQERRQAVQELMCIYIPQLFPMPLKVAREWIIMCGDLRTWINSHSLLLSIYLCASKCNLLPDYSPSHQSLDMYINYIHRHLLAPTEQHQKACDCKKETV